SGAGREIVVRAARRGGTVPPPRRLAGGGEPDCAADHRRGRGGAGGLATIGGGRLSGYGDPGADGAGRHCAAALHLHGRSSRQRDRAACRAGAQSGPAVGRERRAVTAVFVTGTGTDVGKTFLSAALIRHWRAAGRAVAACKPVLSGFDPASATTSDPGVRPPPPAPPARTSATTSERKRP